MASRSRPAPKAAVAARHRKPLYRQVRGLLVDRMIKRVWRPGESLPSEMQLAAELGVSQGTVRKALDDLVAQNLLVRRQGRGTFVNEHDQQRSLFRFFKLVSDSGEHRLPTSRLLSIKSGPASPDEAAALGLRRGNRVVRIVRVRFLDERPTIFECISVPAALFPDLGRGQPLPNTLYALYAERFGVMVAAAREQLRAVAAGAAAARHLGLRAGVPLLEIRRVAIALDGRPVELRVSLCETGHCRYESLLR